MVVNIYYAIAIMGLLSIIFGTFMISERKIQRKYIYFFLLLGGVCLGIYSIYKKDVIFMVLQTAYLAIVIYDIIKLNISKRKR